MAGFLNALSFMAPVGQTLGPAMQIGARQAELDQQKNAFGKLLDTLGPEYEPFRQYFKAGGTPHEVSAAMGGPIGQRLQQQYQTQQWKDFVGPGGVSGLTPDKIWEGVSRGIFTPEEAIKYQGDLLKNQLEQRKLDEGGMLKTDPKFGTFMALHGITTPDQLRQIEQDPDKMKALQPEYEQFAGVGSGSTKLIRDYDPNTGEETWKYVPKSLPAGEIAGHVRPPVGGNPIAVMRSAEMGMHRLQNLMKPIGDSNVPMLLPAEMMKRGVKPSDEYMAAQTQIGQTFATLSTMIMRAGGFRNPQVAQEWMNTHVPKATDSPAMVNSKLKEWFDPGGLLDQYREMLGMNMTGIPGEPRVPFQPDAQAGAGAPPADLQDITP